MASEHPKTPPKLLNKIREDVKVKSWRIPLPDFHFDHQPYNHSHDHRDFFGRETESKSFLKMLQNSRMNSGSYLITGYRGAGKTSFVKKVMDDFSNGVADLANYPTFRALIELPWIQKGYLGASQLWKNTKILPYLFRGMSTISGAVSLILLLIFLFLFPYVNTITDIMLVLFIIVVVKFRQHGWAGVYPMQWARWLFKPVVQVHINLGHNIDNQRNVIFGLVNLLREEYRAQVNRTWLHKLSMLLLLFIFTTALSIGSFKIFRVTDGHETHIEVHAKPTENHSEKTEAEANHQTVLSLHQFLEQRIHSFIFHDPHPEKPDKPTAKDESHVLAPLAMLLGREIPPPVAEQSEAHAAKKSKDEAHHHAPKPLSQLCYPRLNYAHNLPDIHVENHYIAGQPVAKTYSEIEEVSLFREVFLKTPYCALYKASIDLYRFSHQDTHESSTIKQRMVGLMASFYWVYDWVKQVPKEELGQLTYAPRPYHIIHFVIVFFLLLYIRRRLGGPNQILWRLENLCDRIESTEMLDSDNDIHIPFFSRKRHVQRQRLDERQTESLLLQILQDNATQNWFIKPRIVFIFDELDKIHPKRKDDEPATSIELDFSESVRQRKYEVERLLGSFKNLISVAPCYFIFIAGREMMDANLADQGEIRFLYASLFDKVFYIPSFLTDESDENGNDISSMVEQYVCRRLMRPVDALWAYDKYLHKQAEKEVGTDPKAIKQRVQQLRIQGYGAWSLPVYNTYLEQKQEQDELRQRLLFFLQDFIYFLTYRSAGDAKKLDLQFEEFVVPKHSLPESFLGQNELQNELKVYREGDKDFILFFDKKAQYRVQLIAHLFTIFHGTYSRMIRQYGDKLSVSVFSILDYVCKFHSMAFSKRDFERMADALDIHRAPTLPQVIDMIMNHILSPYTRQIQNGFYSFRFVRYIQREIRYISQFSESDMSAFNFSLDESNQIKAHFEQMLKEQTELYHKERDILEDKKDIQSSHYVLPNLHLLIGSINDQDNDYEPAAIAYRTAIEYLHPTIRECLDAVNDSKSKDKASANSICSQTIKRHLPALILYVRANLKLGLLQERRMIYDTSHALYNRICDVIERIFITGKQLQYIQDPEQLLTLCQPAVCSAFLHAKTDPDSKVAGEIFSKAIKHLDSLATGKTTKKSAIHKASANNWLTNDTIAKSYYSLQLRRADMYVLRSEFDQALAIYRRLEKKYQKNYPNYLLKAKIYDGLATCKMAIELAKAHAQNPDTRQQVDGLKQIIENFTIAADSYRETGLGSEEQTVLWKLSYALVMGTLPLTQFSYPVFVDHLFDPQNSTDNLNERMQDIAGRTFADAHTIHQQRLESIGVTNPNLQQMASAPLLHSQSLLQAYVQGLSHQQANIGIEIKNLAAFPMHSRVLGLFLKGMYFYKCYQQRQAEHKDLELLFNAFYLLIQTLEESLDYECGMDLLIPPLGMTRYYIWDVVQTLDGIDKSALSQRFLDDSYFSADRQRYFDVDYCRRKAQVQLIELLSRHRADKVAHKQYDNYVRNRFYLYDAFSDPYSQGLWAVEYGFVPFAQRALEKLR